MCATEAPQTPRFPALAVGVAGWSYDDWKDTVYRLPAPPSQPDLFGDVEPGGKPRYAADPLAFLSEYLDMVEVNSSFYRVPTAKTTASWAARTAGKPGFFFTAKLHSTFTHEFRRDAALAAEFRRAMEPLKGAGMLHGLLVQFRYDFADTGEARQHLAWIREQFHELGELILEVRHKSWESGSARPFFGEQGFTVATLDYPTAPDSFNPYGCVAGRRAYFRLHGRNREKWFARDVEPHEPYNYDYPDAEVAELTQRSEDLLKNVGQLTIVANNHYRGKAVSAALRLKAHLLKQQVAVPPALLDTYPVLRKISHS